MSDGRRTGGAGLNETTEPVAEGIQAGLPPLESLQEMLDRVIALAREQGAGEVEAGLNMEVGLSATVRKGAVETLEFHRDRGLGITLYRDGCKGSASTADFSPEALRETVRAAWDIARHTQADACAGLPEPRFLAREIPDLDLCHPWALTPEEAIAVALECEDAALAEPGITNSEGATLSSHQGLRVYANSHGFNAGYTRSRHSLSCAVIAGRGDGMQRDYWYSLARDPAVLEPAAAVGRRAAERTVRRLGARRLPTCTVPVLLVPEVATGFFRHFVNAVRGSNLYRGASFLVDSLGQALFPPFMHIHEAPHLPGAMGSAPFDGEGVATRARDLVREGVVQGYVLDHYSACRLGMETTGNAGGVHNLVVDPGGEDFAGLVRTLDRGLVVTELMGQGVNLVTGDYSRGAAGFWVEGGEIRHPVQEITIAGNLREMFRGIRAVGKDVDTRGNIRTGSVLLERMTVAGD